MLFLQEAALSRSEPCDRADRGQVLVSDVVRQLVAGKGFSFHQIGAEILKGFEEPVALF
jgi:class 3 adenylate cyclase